MDASNKAFDQVKRILDKLDRSIDEARSKRLGTDEPEAPETTKATSENGHPAASSPPVSGPPRQADRPVPATTPKQPDEPSPRRSAYGRAKPLRRDNGPDASMWRHSNG